MAALMMTLLLLLLSGCGGGNETVSQDARLRQNYAGLTSFTGVARVTADYGDKVYQYDISVSGDLSSGTLEVLSPETIAGTGFSWSDGGGVMTYEEVSLETGTLSPDGLSPADAMPLVLNTLATGKQLAAGEETIDGEKTLFLELANASYQEETSTVCVWLAQESGALRRAEITWEGNTVITYSFTEFSYTFDRSNQETEG